MSEAAKILELIENADPEDTDTLDEIDARVHCYLVCHMTYKGRADYGQFLFDSAVLGVEDFVFNGRKFTRSRDALKDIRPEGFEGRWSLSKHIAPDGNGGLVVTGYGLSGNMPTEELAELYAIIQAIEWERKTQ